MNWILRNKEWLFSGIGGSLLLIALGFLYRFASRRKTTSVITPIRGTLLPQIQASTEIDIRPTAFTKPTPGEIAKQLAALPPFQRRQAADSYKGFRVFWPATLRNLHQWAEKDWRVYLHYDYGEKHPPNLIVCGKIDLEAYPRLKFTHTGEAVKVRGTIVHIDGNDVTLQDVSFEFE